MNTIILRALAGVTTLTAVSMSAVSALDRGGSLADKVLLVALSVVVCLGAHMLLALSRRHLAWVIWIGCLALALLQHITFFTHASLRAGQARVDASTYVSDIAQQEQALTDALATISARPITNVAAELAVNKAAAQRRALIAEFSEAQRAARLRDELVTLRATATTAKVTQSHDPVTLRLAAVSGEGEADVGLGIALVFAVILELTGALLWLECLQPVVVSALPVANPPEPAATADESPSADVTFPVTPESSPLAPDIAPAPLLQPTEAQELNQAVAAGLCKPTVAGIRAYKNCGQARAIELRRELIATSGL